MKKIYCAVIILAFASKNFSQDPCSEITKINYGGQTYHTVAIGIQCWLKENLNVGTMITGSQEQTNNGVIEKYCYNDDPENCETYGGLYQWGEAMQYSTSEGAQGICPGGWHIPNWNDFQVLVSAIIQDEKALNGQGLNQYGGAGTNKSRFSALKGGNRYSDGFFYDLNITFDFWSSTETGTDSAVHLVPNLIDFETLIGNENKNFGYSVRCMKD
jgi:uncharacterized protein (TIGR02145 family)